MSRIRQVLLVFFALVVASSLAGAAVPNQFSVQGVLRNNTGQLQSMMVTVTASLHDASTAGNKLAGPYGPTAVLATSGLFTFPISDPALQTKLGSATQVWLEVSVENDTFARQQVTPQLFALMCGTADSVKGLTILQNGNVGIGTTTPVKRLWVEGDAEVVNGSFEVDTNGTGAGPALAIYSSDPSNNSLKLLVQNDGNVGIGTTTPLAKLDVAGGIRTQYSSSTVQTLVPNAHNTITHNLNIPSNRTQLIFLTNGDTVNNNFVIHGTSTTTPNSFNFYVQGGAAGLARFSWVIFLI